MKSKRLIEKALLEPFNQQDVRFRAQSTWMNNGPQGKAVAYVDNRAICQRLDRIFGVFGWTSSFEHLQGHTLNIREDKAKYTTQKIDNAGFICTISIKFDGEWVSKSDSAGCTNIEAIKGGTSDSMKRAAQQWGIGRYLYAFKDQWIKFNDNSKGSHKSKIKKDKNDWGTDYFWDDPKLTKAFLPKPFNEASFTKWVNNSEDLSDLEYLWRRLDKEHKQNEGWMNLYNNRVDELSPVKSLEESLEEANESLEEANESEVENDSTLSESS